MIQTEIPSFFYKDEGNEPFTECSVCNSKLHESIFGYAVEKAFKRNKITNKPELIFEYAVCYNCQLETQKELSEESIKNISMYFQLYTEGKKISDNVSEEINKKMTNCMISEKPISEQNEYQIGGFFVETKMILNTHFPYALGDKAMNEIQELISEKTQDFLDNFKDKILPPNVRETVPDGRFIFV